MLINDNSLILINKPIYYTSFDVIRWIRKQHAIKKIGHAGTLDPLATGLLILCTGSKTKEISQYTHLEKEYIGRITIGATTSSFDLESTPTNIKTYDHINDHIIYQQAQSFIGLQQQLPPQFSAIKKNGTPLYKFARQGKEVSISPRQVNIIAFDITGIVLPTIDFKIICSSGTYIRSLANDFGQALGVGAYLSSLCRTRIGHYKLEEGLDILPKRTEFFKRKS